MDHINSRDTSSNSSNTSRNTSPHSISNSVHNTANNTNGIISPSNSLIVRQVGSSQFSSPNLSSLKNHKSLLDYQPNNIVNIHSLQYTQALLHNTLINNTNDNNKLLLKFLSTQLGCSFILNKLINGTILLKYGTHGSPHYRYIWCSNDLKSVHWGDLQKKKIHGTVLCTQLDSILLGHTSKLFMERQPKNSDPSNCFSLYTSQRTLDLECLSYNERELWVLCFTYLIDYTRAIQTNKQSTVTNNVNKIINNVSLINTLELLLNDTNTTINAIDFNPNTITNTINNDSLNLNESLHTTTQSTSSLKSAAPMVSSPRTEPLVMSLDEARKKASRLEIDIERSKEDNRKLLVNSARKMIKLQEQLDVLIYENDVLKQKLAKQ